MSQFYKDLEQEIINSYTEGVTLDQAEKLAGRFLHAQLSVSHDLSVSGLDARMRKTGVKAVKAGIYLDICQKSEKKPTEAQIEAQIQTNPLVQTQQNELDAAEVQAQDLERLYNVFQQAHVYYRQMSRGVQG